MILTKTCWTLSSGNYFSGLFDWDSPGPDLQNPADPATLTGMRSPSRPLTTSTTFTLKSSSRAIHRVTRVRKSYSLSNFYFNWIS